MPRLKQIVIWVILVFMIAPAWARAARSIVAELREKVSQEIPYEFGTVKEVTIVPDQKAVRLICSDNPESVEEILIGANSQHLFIYCILSSGSVTGGGSTWPEGPGSFRQVGSSAAIGMWERGDEKIHVQFQLTDDDNAIIQSYRKLERAAKSFTKGRFSQSINNWGAMLDDSEAQIPRLTPEQRVEAFTRLWSTVKFNFANFDLVPEFYSLDYVMAWMAEAIIEDYLKEVLGSHWIFRPETGQFLKKWWKQGNRYDIFKFLEQNNLDSLSPERLLRRWQRVLG